MSSIKIRKSPATCEQLTSHKWSTTTSESAYHYVFDRRSSTKKSGHQSRSGPSPPVGDPSIPFESHEQLPLKIHEHQTSYSLLTRFDSRIALTGPTHISTTPQKGSAPSSYFFHLEKQAQVPGPHPGDHSHRPPPGWVGGNNKHTLQVSMHTSSTNLAAAISTSSTGTITSILHKRDLSTQQLPCPRNINTLHPRTRPLREKGCLCPSPTKPKTTTLMIDLGKL